MKISRLLAATMVAGAPERRPEQAAEATPLPRRPRRAGPPMRPRRGAPRATGDTGDGPHRARAA